MVDDHGKLMGLITVDDVIDVMRDEATEDILRMAGTSEEEMLLGYKSFQIARLRLPWLLTTLVGGVVTGTLMWYFKSTLEQVIMLISFIPVITGMGGVMLVVRHRLFLSEDLPLEKLILPICVRFFSKNYVLV